MSDELWVAGWFTELCLSVLGITALFYNNVQSTILITGAMVIGVMRQIEKERRRD